MSKRRALWPVIGLGLVWLLSLTLGVGAEQAHPSSAPVAYRVDAEGSFTTLIVRVVGALLLVSAVGVGLVYAAKRLVPAMRGFSVDGKRRVELLESHHITPRLTLFVIAYDGTTVLLAQSGDRVIQIVVPARGRASDIGSSAAG